MLHLLKVENCCPSTAHMYVTRNVSHDQGQC